LCPEFVSIYKDYCDGKTMKIKEMLKASAFASAGLLKEIM